MSTLVKIVLFISVILISGCKSDSPKADGTPKNSTENPTNTNKTNSSNSATSNSPDNNKSFSLSNTVALGSINYRALEYRLIQKINEERRAHSLPLYSSNNTLKKAAAIHNDYMVRNNILDHREVGTTTPDMVDRVKKVGGKFRTFGENIQYEGFIVRTTNGVESIVAPTYEELANNIWLNWKNSPSHYKNIINPEFKYLGTALKWSEEKKAVFATQVYGG